MKSNKQLIISRKKNGHLTAGTLKRIFDYEDQYNFNNMIAQYDLEFTNPNSDMLSELTKIVLEELDNIFSTTENFTEQDLNDIHQRWLVMKEQEKQKQAAQDKSKQKSLFETLKFMFWDCCRRPKNNDAKVDNSLMTTSSDRSPRVGRFKAG